MSPLVLHYEKKSESDLIEKQFLDVHKDAAGFAEKCGVLLCMENIEVEYVEPVIDFINKVSHENMKMTYDMGHGFLASRYFGFDFLESIRKSKDLIAHLHLSDNTGTFEELRITDRFLYDKLSLEYRFAYGRGDIHIPPLWGKIPYTEVSEIMKGFKGTAVCEFYSDFYKPFFSKIYSDVKNLFDTGGNKK